MSTAFDAYLGFAETTASIHLAGDLSEHDVPRLRSLIDQAARQPVRRLVLDAAELTSMDAGGARCLAFAQQQLPAGAEIVVDGAGAAVLEALRFNGLDRSVTVVAARVPAA
ncbi:STAS domain-containing protein [Streptomyces sp. CSDS2]|uniref:STAS domain-containing protein n=1 Tax=Streptomyces sp. CSDS2 TaxID=3055051 RepID=UPI0025B161C7|nr:STAS domain-containing protein [Streptomyces sp. CSDS2]MDN3258746.1 STAS domain-containing protein [Streptomyces sp. CSDS2]